MISSRVKVIKTILTDRKYILISIIAALIYFTAYYAIINYFLDGFARFFSTYSKSYAYPAFFLNILLSLLVGVNISLLVHRISMLKRLNSRGSLISSIGLFTGALANGCPGCFAGLFPMFLSLFGITATLSVLPFNGLELQAASMVLLSFSIFFLSSPRGNVCKVVLKSKN